MGRKPFISKSNSNDSKKRKKEETKDVEELDYMSVGMLEVVKEKEVKKESLGKKKTVIEQKKSHSALREEALATPISKSNVGFKLLQQMGYKEGEGLGKQQEGITDPIELLMKRNRSGLGVDEEPPLKISKISSESTSNSGITLDDAIKRFHNHQGEKFKERKVNRQLKASVTLCITLDNQIGIQNNSLLPYQFMPKDEIVDDNEDNLDSDKLSLEEKEEKLSDIISYLRNNHYYCFFCGSKFTSEEELLSKCPGETEEEHLLT